MEPQSCLFLQRNVCNSTGVPSGQVHVTVFYFVVQDLNMKLTTIQEQATTVKNSMQTSEEIAQAHELKNKVRMYHNFVNS